jgi:hypothetical protein
MTVSEEPNELGSWISVPENTKRYEIPDKKLSLSLTHTHNTFPLLTHFTRPREEFCHSLRWFNNVISSSY